MFNQKINIMKIIKTIQPENLLPPALINCETSTFINPRIFNSQKEIKVIPLPSQLRIIENKNKNKIKLIEPTILQKNILKLNVDNAVKVNDDKIETKNTRRKEFSYEALIRSITLPSRSDKENTNPFFF